MFGAGGSAVIAKKMGEGRLQQACEDLSLLTLLALGAALLVLLIGFAALRPILQLLGANSRLYPYCRNYFAVIIGISRVYAAAYFSELFRGGRSPQTGSVLRCVRGNYERLSGLRFYCLVSYGH